MSIDNDCVSNLENVEVNPQMEQVKSMMLYTVGTPMTSPMNTKMELGTSMSLTEGEMDKSYSPNDSLMNI